MANMINAFFAFGSTVEAGRAKSKALEYNADSADNAVATLKQQSTATDQALDRSIRRSMGSAHAAYGGSGVDMSSGSPLTALADASRQGTLDRLTSKYNFKTKETQYHDQATQFRIGARNAVHAALVKGIMNGLSAFDMGGSSSNSDAGMSPSTSTSAGMLSASMRNGPGTYNVSWPGSSGQWSGGNSLTGGEYTGPGSTAVSWPGSDGGSSNSGGSWM